MREPVQLEFDFMQPRRKLIEATVAFPAMVAGAMAGKGLSATGN